MRWDKRAKAAEARICRVIVVLSALAFVVFFAMCHMARAHDVSHADRAVIERAAACGVDPYLALELLHVEDLAGLTAHRGMLVAKACFESRGNPEAVGDGGKAIGLLQLWPWAEVTTDRRHPIGSAYAYLGALLGGVKRAKRHCPGARRVFRLAWIRVNRGPFWRRQDRRGEARCHGADPAGLKLLRRWRRGA
jgi:hypothetical protein